MGDEIFILFLFYICKENKTEMLKISPKYLRIILSACMVVLLLSSCQDERQTVLEESVRLITNATIRVQDVNHMELRQLRQISDQLRDSLSVLQNKHPNVILSDEDEAEIRVAMNKFSQAQENAIAYFTNRINDLENSIDVYTAETDGGVDPNI